MKKKCVHWALVCAAMAGAGALRADTISSNLSATTAGTEAATGDTWLTASFGTSTSSAVLSSVALLLSNPVSGVAEVDLYTNSTSQPGSLVGTLTAASSYTSALSDVTFSSSGLTLSANSTYWIVLKALSGEFDWGWTADNSGTGVGFQGTWGISSDAGSTWYTYAVYPTQFSVTTTDPATTVDVAMEPGTGLLLAGGLLVGFVFLRRGRRWAACGA